LPLQDYFEPGDPNKRNTYTSDLNTVATAAFVYLVALPKVWR
jgi:hypothetical protein